MLLILNQTRRAPRRPGEIELPVAPHDGHFLLRSRSSICYRKPGLVKTTLVECTTGLWPVHVATYTARARPPLRPISPLAIPKVKNRPSNGSNGTIWQVDAPLEMIVACAEGVLGPHNIWHRMACFSSITFEPGHGIPNFFFRKSRGPGPRHFAARNFGIPSSVWTFMCKKVKTWHLPYL